MKNILIKSLIILCSIFFASILCEISLRIFYDKIKNYNLEMWRYAKDLKKPLYNEKLPFIHYSNVSGNFYGVDIKTNSYGFRGTEIPLKKNNTTKRILFVGDSFTLGWGVPYDSTFSKVLERRLNSSHFNYSVINSGIGNYNSTMEVELFKLQGIKFKPDIVILMYFINDVEPLPKISVLEYSFIKNSYLFAFLFDKIQKIKVSFNKDLNWENYYNNLYTVNNLKAQNENKASLEELINICKKDQIRLMIVNIPELHKLNGYPFNFATQFIKNIAVEKEVKFLDLLPAIKNYDAKNLWVSQEDAHANSTANRIFADAIFNKLMECEFIK